MPDPIRILVADDHPLMRSGICAEIEGESDMVVVALAENGGEALELFRNHRPDVSLIDLRMPVMSGLDLIVAMKKECKTARIVVLTSSTGDIHAIRAFRSGADGYLLKHMLRNELVQTIRGAHEGKKRIPDEIARLLATNAVKQDLTEREVEVLKKVAQGLSNKEIGKVLCISLHTVKGHLKLILEKLEANDRAHAVTTAIQRGFFDL